MYSIWYFIENVFTGEYWVDPNDGDIRDAILVYCDMDKRATCIYPSPAKSPQIAHAKPHSVIWLSQSDRAMKVTQLFI